MKYNRLELVLLGDKEYSHLEYQPLLEKYGIYNTSGKDFLSYGRKPTMDIKKEIIERIYTNKIIMYNLDDFDNTFRFWDNCYMEEVVLFNFFHVKRGYEHEAVPFLSDMSIESGFSEQWGLLEDGTILDPDQTSKLMNRLNEKKRLEALEAVAVCKYSKPTGDISHAFKTIGLESEIKRLYGDNIKTIQDAREKYKELAKLHHPDVGGDPLMFRAIVSAGIYLADKLRQI